MSETDYYKILGVNKNASDGDIKKAYRKLAMKYHPDRLGSDKAAEEKFKTISEAYAVLSDKEKRKQYDMFGSNGFQQRYSQEDIFRGFDLNNILREFGFGGGGGFGNNTRFDFGGRPGGRNQRPVKGADLEYELPLTLSEVINGTDKTISYNHDGQANKIAIKIPKGMVSGKKLRLNGKGQPSAYGGPSGDLFVKARVNTDPLFRIEGHDLYFNREIKLSEALLGTQLAIPTPDNRQLSLKIPSGTKHKTKFRLSGNGLPHINDTQKGDLYVEIKVKMAKTLNEQQIQLIEKLAETGL
ncbi:J domain-containing protein [Desulfococcaceae bacterium HSG9]|nr:J domain-containing protein [Desulfococcaceae bacterium HSG9]